jgi:hypothetical protein
MAKTFEFDQRTFPCARRGFYDSSAGQYTHYFWSGGYILPDNFEAGDYFFVSSIGVGGRFVRLEVSEGFTPVQATGYTWVWEYYDWDDTWKTLPNLVDGTNGLQQIGTVSWDMPSSWGGGPITPVETYVRLRVVTVSSVQNRGYVDIYQRVNFGRCELYAYGGTSQDPVTFADIYEYLVDTLGRPDLMVREALSAGIKYTSYVKLRIEDYLQDTDVTVIVDNGFWTLVTSGGTLLRCALISARGSNSSEYMQHGGEAKQCYIGWHGRGGGLYLGGGGVWTYCLFSFTNALCYVKSQMSMPHSVIAGSGWIQFQADFDGAGLVFGGHPFMHTGDWTVRNVVFTSAVSSWSSNSLGSYTFVDCSFGAYPDNTGSGKGDAFFYSTSLLTIVDEEGTPLVGAAVTIWDKNGDEVTGSPFTADENGQIEEEILYAYNEGDEHVWVTPHTIRVVASGFMTQDMILYLDPARDETVVLQRPVTYEQTLLVEFGEVEELAGLLSDESPVIYGVLVDVE